MENSLAKLIDKMSYQMRLLKASQEDNAASLGLSERDLLLLNNLLEKGSSTISDIANADPTASISTISTAVTSLWRKKLLTKIADPDDQRTTIIELTQAGTEVITEYNLQRAQRFKALFKAIEMTDEEKEVFLRVLNRAVNYFEAYIDGHFAAHNK